MIKDLFCHWASSWKFWQDKFIKWNIVYFWLPRWLSGKESACNAGVVGDVNFIPVSGRSPGGGNCNPLQYSWREKSCGQRSLVDIVHQGLQTVRFRLYWPGKWLCKLEMKMYTPLASPWILSYRRLKKKKDFDSLKRVQLLWRRNAWQIGQLSLFSRVKANCLAFEFIIHHFRSHKLVKTSIWVLQFHLKRTRVTEKSILSCIHSYMFIALHLALPSSQMMSTLIKISCFFIYDHLFLFLYSHFNSTAIYTV